MSKPFLRAMVVYGFVMATGLQYSLGQTIAWNTFLGSNDDLEVGRGIAIDQSGNLFVVGTCAKTWGSPIRPFAGGTDAFVAKLSPSGVLLWNTFLGGTGVDEGCAISVDVNGNIYVVGMVWDYGSPSWGSPLRGLAGGKDAFAAKLDANGALQWNTFLGGSGDDQAAGVAADPSGGVLVVGFSSATWETPVRAFTAGEDAFAAKLGSNGALAWNTFLGGTASDEGLAAATDAVGNLYLTGWSSATWGAPLRPIGGDNAFVAKLNGSGILQWNTFLGGYSDSGFGIALDMSGNVYVTGYSWNSWGSPVHSPLSEEKTFAAKLSNEGVLSWNTFLGGGTTGGGFGGAIAVDAFGSAFIISTGGSYMLGTELAYVTKLTGSGATAWSNIIDSVSNDEGYGIAVGGNRSVYFTGMSAAAWGTNPVRPYSGGEDAYVAKIQDCDIRTDFNMDRQEDILWRYYGPGGFIRAWYLGNIAGSSPLSATGPTGLLPGGQSAGRAPAGPEARATFLNRMKVTSPRGARNPMRVVGSRSEHNVVSDPRRVGGVVTEASMMHISDPRQVNLAWPATNSDVKLAAAPSVLGGGDVMPVGDLTWQIVGTGDFNNDTHADILWRNSASGTNVVWYMNGVNWAGSAALISVSDQTWQIVGTGDFNNDTHVDILWRNSASGANIVWYMDGVNWSSSAEILGVSDPTWRIVGTGDFNKDGKVDILWRYNGSGGYDVVWHMNGASWSSSAELIHVGDTTWQIVGTGDYDNDGNVDILWRYNGAGGYNVIWYMNGVAWRESAELIPVPDLNWRIVSR